MVPRLENMEILRRLSPHLPDQNVPFGPGEELLDGLPPSRGLCVWGVRADDQRLQLGPSLPWHQKETRLPGRWVSRSWLQGALSLHWVHFIQQRGHQALP